MDTVTSFGKLLVVSPHLDDAVFSCGELISRHAGTLVVTVFSGAPSGFNKLTDWDAASGFLNAEEAIAARKQEDYAALHMLAALPLWLDFCDNQYQATPPMFAVSSTLQKVIDDNRPETIVFPAGLFHSDHLLVHQAMLMIYRDHLDKNWLMYEDALYRRIAGLLQKRLAELLHARIEATPIETSDNPAQHVKRQAVQCYASQLQALSRTVQDATADAFAHDRLWRLTPIKAHANGAHTHGRH
ncbi:MAG: PIG-L deacetylase family protein [Burkholderiaceae bacterium]